MRDQEVENKLYILRLHSLQRGENTCVVIEPEN